jgi:hypothetical protein
MRVDLTEAELNIVLACLHATEAAGPEDEAIWDHDNPHQSAANWRTLQRVIRKLNKL